MKLEKILVSLKPYIDKEKILDILRIFEERSISVFAFDDFPFSNSVKVFSGEKMDAIFVFGGDGAILRTVERIIKIDDIPPIVGVNMGKVGFLTFGEDSLELTLDMIMRENFVVDNKTLMGFSSDNEELFALNDVVVRSDDLYEFEIRTDVHDVVRVRADGVIVSSQTGSTAYNLSVGGPLVLPGIDVFVISFIAPFSLSARPLVVSPKRKIRLSSKKPAKLYSDGRFVRETSKIEVFYSHKSIKILRSVNFNFFDVLRRKLE
ncbi:MAG: NAD(+)/NADH kinase [Candidatus Calescibacterium sp.]|nr:NAD(+)/NADH kinase [Candidatus Calescibacterium sp.]MCX7733408.1 NAD(+)/NADH kinase [bacterium]MDW8087960.1 NAD(+)/NADH kinase [Candidatus Calescibacterium sp.]